MSGGDLGRFLSPFGKRVLFCPGGKGNSMKKRFTDEQVSLIGDKIPPQVMSIASKFQHKLRAFRARAAGHYPCIRLALSFR